MATDSSVPTRWHIFRNLSRRRKILVFLFVILLALLATPVITYAYFSRDIADPERLMNRNNTGIVLLDRHGEVIYKLGSIHYQEDVKLDAVSDHLEHALLASEDQEFYSHKGYSIKGIARSFYSNVQEDDMTRYGGSTITQQLVKNKLLNSNKNFFRKYQEVAMAIAVERHYTKDEILEMYLNSVYFGEGAFGIQQAAQTYFNKTPAKLAVAESAMLIGLLPAPSAFSPISGDKESAAKQQASVLDLMVEAGYIKSEEADKAKQTKLAYNKNAQKQTLEAPHFAMMVLEALRERYGEEMMVRNGFAVTTSLDLKWQKRAEEYTRQRVAELSGQQVSNASMVAMDPNSGEIRALVGSVDWDNKHFGKVNMALAARQPGSSFKPIYYNEAINRKLITPASVVEDERKTYGGTYRPQNYDFRYRGDITIRRALALSLNIPAVEVMQKLGTEEAASAARQMGLSTVTKPEKYGLSLALGTAEVKLLEMVNAYAAFANNGEHYGANPVMSIRDKFDHEVFRSRPVAKRVTSAEAAYVTSSILSDKAAGASTFFDSLTVPGRQVASKTGTTDDYRDAWTIGYTPSLAIGVWVGNNDNKPMSGVAGSGGAAPLWKKAMMDFLGNTPPETFERPKGITEKEVCLHSGLEQGSGTYKEIFIKGTEPQGCQGRVKSAKNARPDKEDKKGDTGDKKKENDQEETSSESGRGADDGEVIEPPEDEPPADEEDPPVDEDPTPPPPPPPPEE